MPDASERLAILIEANTKSYENAMKRIEQKTNQALRASERSVKRLDTSLKSSASSVLMFSKAFGGAFAGAAAVRAAGQLADGWERVGRSLRSTEDIFKVRLRSQEALADMAIRTRSDLESLVTLYTRTAAATADLGLAEKDVARVTETVAKALKLGSASAGEQASVLTQLSQALQKGKLDGDEFRSVMENAGIIQVALTRRLQVTKGELMEMSKAGQIGVRDLVESLKDISPEVDRAFGATRATIGESLTNIKTALMQAVGEFDNLTGASEKLVSALDAVTGALRSMGEGTDWTLERVRELNSLMSELSIFGMKVIDVEARNRQATGGPGSMFSEAVRKGIENAIAANNQARGEIMNEIGALQFNIAEGVVVHMDAANKELQRLQDVLKEIDARAKELRASLAGVAGINYDPLTSMLGRTGAAWPAMGIATSTGVPIETARQYVGAQEVRDKDVLANLFHQAGMNVDPEMVKWCAAFVNAVLGAHNLPGTGSLAAKSFMNYGTATETPQIGDIVVLSREGGGHVGFYEGMSPSGKVRVLGGNQGNEVAVDEYDPSRVLGYRRLPGVEAGKPQAGLIEAEIAAHAKTAEDAADAARKAAEDAADAQQTLTDAKADFEAQLKEENAALDLEISNITKSTAEAERASVKQDLTNQLMAAGIPITKEYAAAIDDLANKAAARVQAQEAFAADEQRSQEIMQNTIARADAVRDLASDVIGGLATDLQNGVKPAEALANALGKIGQKLMDIAVNQLVSGMFGAPGTLPGGLLGGLFGASAASSQATTAMAVAGGLFAKGGIMTSHGPVPLNSYQGGGIANSPQMALFGEGSTPEAYVPLPNGRSIPVNLNMGRLAGRGVGGGRQKVAVDNTIRVEPSLMFVATVDQRVRQGQMETMRAMPSYLADRQRRGI